MNGLGDHEKRLAEQLAAAQAVIAEARSLHGNHPDDWAGSCLLCRALSQSPTDALQAVKAPAWDEGYTRGFYDREMMSGEVRDASEGPSENPSAAIVSEPSAPEQEADRG